MKLRLLTFFIILLCSGFTCVRDLQAQVTLLPPPPIDKNERPPSLLCGTEVTPQRVAFERARLDSTQTAKAMFLPTNCFGKTLSVVVHIVLDSLGDPGISPATINPALAGLNSYFAPICISFQVCEVNYIPNFKYNIFQDSIDEPEVINLYSRPNTINIYYVNTIIKIPASQPAGYAYFPGGPDFIVITKGSAGSVKVLTHEMGHFFGLYHTFETKFGQELANGTNCVTSGDLVCDTPADPGLSNTPSPDCQLQPYINDPNGQWYVPDIGNIMSYYDDDCMCGFTPEQYNSMSNNYQNNRFYLW